MTNNDVIQIEDLLKQTPFKAKKPKEKEEIHENYLKNPKIYNKDGSVKVGKEKFIGYEPNPQLDKFYPPKDEDIYSLPTINASLNMNANAKLKSYIKNSPQYKTLKNKIDILTTEYKNYLSIGSKEFAQNTKDLIDGLKTKQKDYIQYVKIDNTPKSESINKIKSSPILKELKQKRLALEHEYKMNNANSINYKLIEYRKHIELLSNVSNLLDNQNSDVLDIQDYLDNDKLTDATTLTGKYELLCTHISSILELPVEKIKELPTGTIKVMLEKALPDNTELKNKIDNIKFETSKEMKKIKGIVGTTDVIFEIFDFETEEQQTKDFLASANIKNVSKIAYKKCSNLNLLHLFDDAVSYGLLGLSVAINKWVDMQKMQDSSVTFDSMSYRTIAGSIDRGLYELISTGTHGASDIATIKTKRKKQVQALSENPEFKNVPKDILEDIFNEILDKLPEGGMTESAYVDMVGGHSQDGDSGDIWANAVVDEFSEDNLLESKEKYNKLIQSIKDLFNLFDNKETAKSKIFGKKRIFDKYDYKLFLLWSGIDYNKNAGSENAKYNHEEIGKLLAAYYAEDGDVRTFTASAISTRIKTLLERIKSLMIDNPSIKQGFEYLWMYIYDISYKKEELGVSFEYDDILSNKKISDIYDKYQTSIEDEIADSFIY